MLLFAVRIPENNYTPQNIRQPIRFKHSTIRSINTFNSTQDYLYSAFYGTIVAKQLYRKLSFYNRFIYCRNLIYLKVYRYTSIKKIEYHEKGQYFLSLISESETHILYRFITHRVTYFKPLFLEVMMIMAYR